MTARMNWCPSALDGFICSDDMCRNAAEDTLCGAPADLEALNEDDEGGYGDD